MTIFGSRGVTTTPQMGKFHCPSCGIEQDYKLRRVRRCITLYFVPIIPLGILGEYVECLSCKGTYKRNVLGCDPNDNTESIEPEYHAAIRKVVAHMLLADGVTKESEIAAAQIICTKVSGRNVARSDILADIKLIEETQEKLSMTLTVLQGALNPEGKELVAKAAFQVAMADGSFQHREKALLLGIGQDLGMTAAQINGVISSTDYL